MARKNIGKIVSTSFLKEGDVIMSPDFAYCQAGCSRRPSFSNKGKELTFSDRIKRGVEHPCKNVTFGTGSFKHVNKERANKEYLVVRIEEELGETTLMFNSSVSYREIDIFVKQLKNGFYDGNGETIYFSAVSGRTNYIERVRLVRHMEKTYV